MRYNKKIAWAFYMNHSVYNKHLSLRHWTAFKSSSSSLLSGNLAQTVYT